MRSISPHDVDYLEFRFKADLPVSNPAFMVIGDSPSQKDLKNGRCFSGDGAFVFTRDMESIGLSLKNASLHVVLPYWPSGGDSSSVIITGKSKAESLNAIRHGDAWIDVPTKKAFDRIRSQINDQKPPKILLLGGLALYAVFGHTSISAFRGSCLDFICDDGTVIPCVPTFHPSAIARKRSWLVPYMRDLQRFKEGNFVRPDFNIRYDLPFNKACAELDALLARIEESPISYPLAIDVETRKGFITVLGFAWSTVDALVIPFTRYNKANNFTVDEELTIVKKARAILHHPKCFRIGQNFQYDSQYLAKLYGVSLRIDQDTMVDAHCIWTKGLELSLSFLASLYCSWYRYWKEDGKDFHTSWKTEDEQIQYWQYNGFDCCYTYEVATALREHWGSCSDSKWKEAHDFQLVMQNQVVKPVLDGIRFDSRKQKKMLEEITLIKKQYTDWFEYMIPNELIAKSGKSPWWDSSTRLSHFLYNQLGVAAIRDKKTGSLTTGGDAPKKVGASEPLLRRIMTKLDEYRSINQFISLYLTSPPSPEDGRMRTQYKLAGTDTFRLASSKDAFGFGLNLQNISKG